MHMKYHITGTRRGLGKLLKEQYGSVDSLKDADIFINCKHDEFSQVILLYEAVELNIPRIVNIGSNSGDGNKPWPHKYAIEKAALDKANEQLYYQGANTTVIRFGYFDSERVSMIDEPKMDIKYCADVVSWILKQPYRIKDITLTI